MSSENSDSAIYDSWELVDPISPDEFDVVLTDLNEKKLLEIGKRKGKEHLSTATFPTKAFPCEGFIYGPNKRLMIALVCRRFKKPHETVNVWFLADTGAPFTYITKKTIETLIGPDDPFSDTITVSIQDPKYNVSGYLSHGSFKGANILGMSYFQQLNLSIEKLSLKHNTFKIVKND